MSVAGDSAEEIVKIVLDGTEVAFKIVGEGAKNIGAVLIAMMRDKKQNPRGKTRLMNMLKTGKELKIYTFKVQDLKKFAEEAKSYGVGYCLLAKKRNQKLDGVVDIMIQAEDAPKVNRIADRFKFADVDRASISKDIGLDMEDEKQNNKSEEEKLIDDLLSKPLSKEELTNEQTEMPSPSSKNTEEKSQSEISSNTKPINKKTIKKEKKKSVKKELQEITKEVKIREANKAKERESLLNNQDNKSNSKQHKEQNKGKHYKVPKHLDYSNNITNKLKSRKKVR